jgi:hypothetical protein
LKIQLLTTCDFAEDLGGKLCILGIFDNVTIANAEKNFLDFTVAIRVLFDKDESGEKSFKISVVDSDEKNVIEPSLGKVEIKNDNNLIQATNICFRIRSMPFNSPNLYMIKFEIEDQSQWIYLNIHRAL